MGRAPGIDITSRFDDRGVREAERGMRRVRGSARRTGASLGRFGARGAASLARIGRNATIAAGALVAVGAAIGTKKLIEDEKVLRQTENVIKTTGKAANVTAKHVVDLGNAVEAYSGHSNSTVQAGANLILTFKGIRNEAGRGNDVFDRTVKLSVDMAQKFADTSGGALDLRSSSTLLAKALNDPIRGLTSLRRVGADLGTETEELVRKMAEQGDVMGAQKLILQELESQYGGAAKAFGDSTAGQIEKTKREFEATSAELSKGLLPVIRNLSIFIRTDLIPRARDLAKWWGDNVQPTFERLGRFIERNWPQWRVHAKETFETISDAVRDTWEWIEVNLLPTLEVLGRRGVRIAKALTEVFEDLRPVLEGIAKTFRELVEAALALVRGDFKAFGKNLGQAWTEGFADALAGVPGALGNLLKDPGALASLAQGVNPGTFIGSRIFRQRGGPIPGHGSGDTVPAMLEPGEFVLNRKAVAAVGRSRLERVNRAVPRFATGGYVQPVDGGAWRGGPGAGTHSRSEGKPAYQWQDDDAWDIFAGDGTIVRAVASGTVGRVSPFNSDSRFWGHGLYLNVAGGELFYKHLKSVAVSPGQTVQAGQALGRLGTGVNGGPHLHLASRPLGLLSSIKSGRAFSPTAAANQGGAIIDEGPSPADLRRQKVALVKRARALATGPVSLGRSPSEVAASSIAGRHRDDSLQDKRVRSHVEATLAKRGVTNPDKVRAVAEASVLKTRKREVMADARDVRRAGAKVRAAIRKARKRRKRLYRQLAKTPARRQDALRRLYDGIGASREHERALVFELRGLIAQAADLQAEAAELDFDIGELAKEIAELPNVEPEAASSSAASSSSPELARALEGQRIAERRAGLAEGFIRTIGSTGDLAGRGGAVTINVNTLHPGDPALRLEIAEWIVSAFGDQGARPATSTAVA